jgi:predicted NBD/HSP70 family sugar kinase
LTRADLARKTGLTKVTISDLVTELIEDGLILETGLSTTIRTGKPAVTLAVRDDTSDIIALDLAHPDRFRGGVLSLRGESRAEEVVSLDGELGDKALEAILDLIGRCIARATQPILGIGVGSPGIVDAEGTVIAAPRFNWADVKLQTIIAHRFHLPTVVQNDANVAVLGERAFGQAGPDVIRIQIARGVGAGLMLAGSLVLGATAAAGEIAHVVIEHQGSLCTCGKHGCLETWIAEPVLRARLDADSADRTAILQEAGRRLGIALSPIVGVLDIPEIIIGAPEGLIDESFLDACSQLITERTHTDFRRDITLKTSSLGDEAVLLGAVSLVLRTTLGVS